jgi:adenylate cyclase
MPTLAEELDTKVSEILDETWDTRDGNVVPSQDSVALDGGAVKLEGTVLYADLFQSSLLATDFQQRTAGKVIRTFLYCMCRLIKEHDGVVTAFDGDRVMAVFLGDTKNSHAASCALKMNYVVTKIIEPKVTDYFTSLRETQFEISHCVGVDTSSILAIRAGQRGDNDLVWVGRAPNLAAKLSEIRNNDFHSWISEEVFSRLNAPAKFGGNPPETMWRLHTYDFAGEQFNVYGSTWYWQP